MEHAKLFQTQTNVFQLTKCSDEFETMQSMFRINNQLEACHAMNLHFMNELKSAEESVRNATLSTQFRKLGNDYLKNLIKTKSPDHLYICGELYTKAILKAPDKSLAAAFAYANRAVVLQKMGMYRQANDDCVAATEYNYPKELAHKLLLRQAWCAVFLEDPLTCRLYLDRLTQEHADKSLTLLLEIEHIKDYLKNVCLEQKADIKKENTTKKNKTEHDSVTLYKAVELKYSEDKGRFMTAKEDILSTDLIFEERALSFVPIGNALVCHNCADTLFIPYPCLACKARVVYCSLACRKEHAKTHDYECAGYKNSFFSAIGIGHPALRVLLDHIAEILPFFSDKRSAQEIWQSLIDGEGMHQTLYKRSFDMCSNYNNMDTENIVLLALNSNLILSYLVQYTNFIEWLVDETELPRKDCLLITGALLLRHQCQLMVNAHLSYTLVPKYFSNSDNDIFPLLAPKTWVRPFFPRKGQLHKFSHIAVIATINLPYYSLLNHSCEQMVQPSFKGRNVSIYAHQNIDKGAEIANTYTTDHKSSMFDFRQDSLSSIYYFNCECAACVRKNPDEAYCEYHRYRCTKCRAEFLPNLPNERSSLKWWLTDLSSSIICSNCNTFQNFSWLNNFLMKLENCNDPNERRVLYKYYEQSKHQLGSNNELKMYLASEIIESCFKAYDDDAVLNDDDFQALANIVVEYLAFLLKKHGEFTLQYAASMTYLWDIIALGKGQKHRHAMSRQKEVVKLLALDTQVVFTQYYESYIQNADNLN